MSLLRWKQKLLPLGNPQGGGGKGGGGGGGSGNQTVTTSNIPTWARPGMESLIHAGMQSIFPNMQAVKDENGKITSYNLGSQAGYTPFNAMGGTPASQQALSAAQSSVAGFNPLQQQVFQEAMGMQGPGQFGTATGMAGAAGEGGIGSVTPAYGYGAMGAGYGQQGANIGLGSLGYGQAGANIGGLGVAASGQGFGAGQQFAQQATDPRSVAAYMSPYMQNVVDTQKAAAIRDYEKTILPTLSANAARANAFGSSRHAIERAEAARNLGAQLQGLQAQGTQQAFQNAQAQQQFGANLGLQGLQAGLQGLQTGLQGQQTGLQGIQGALAGTAQGMQGAQTGLQGVGAAQAGYGLAGQQAANLANIGAQQQATDLARLGFQSGQGAAIQQQQQNILNQAMANYNTMQNYPMTQLAQIASLYTGAPQNITQTGYQAAPSTVSQVAGLGALAYGLSRKAGGPIKEKKYSSGGVTSIDRKVLNDPFAFSAETINRGIKSGAIDKMIGAIALSQLQDKPKAPAQAPQGTILGELEAQAAGIPSLPTNLPTVKAAGGGIIAFDKGGYTSYGEEAPYDPNEPSIYSTVGSFFGSPLERIGSSIRGLGLTTKQERDKEIKARTLQDKVGNDVKAGEPDKKPDANKPGIVIHDDKKPNAPAAPAPAKGVDYSQDYAGINDLLKEYTGLIRGTMGDEAQKKEDAKSRLWTNLGFGLLGGTSPYAAQNIGKAGLEATAEYQKEMNQNEALKRQAVGQLVNLGIKGVELKNELKKLGITEDYYKAHARYFDAAAGAKGTGSGAKLGSIPFSELRKLESEYEGYLSDPKAVLSSPFARLIPPETDPKYGYIRQGLRAKPGTPSYNNAMQGAREFAEAHKQSILNKGMVYGSRGNPLAGLLE